MQFLKSKLVLGAALGVLALGVFYFLGAFSSGDISLDITGPDKSPRLGEPFELKVNFGNNSRADMKDVKLKLTYPEGAVPFNAPDATLELRDLGEIKSGGIHQETFQAVITPLPTGNISRVFIATVSYGLESLVARFEKSKNVSVGFADNSLKLDLKTPDKVFAGEEFESNLDYQTQTEDPLDYFVRVTYPAGFTFTSSSGQVKQDTNLWKLDKGKGKLTFRGKVDLPDNSDFVIKVDMVANILGKEYIFAEKSPDITVAESPLSLTISLADPNKSAYYPGETLNYILNYKNNTQVELQGIVAKAQLLGVMYDFSTLKSQGVFNNLNNTLVWDSKSLPELRSLSAGASGDIAFSLNLKNDYPIKRLNDKNFTLKVNARIESPTVPYLIAADKTVSSAVLESKVGGKTLVQTKVYFRDADSGILNNGPLPPKSGTPTEFTVHLILVNYSTDVSGLEVKVPLQDGVVFTGKVKSNTTSQPEVSESGEVVWKLDKIFATAGITAASPEAIFQIRATPGNNSLSNYMSLLGETSLKAHDEFTGLDIGASSPGVTTRLPSDPTLGPSDGIVIQ